MSEGGKGHIVAGGLAMLGMVFARAADSCGSMGKAARSFDDVASLGARGARGLDPVSLGTRRLGDDMWLHPGVDSDTLRLARTAAPGEDALAVSKLTDDEVLHDMAEFAAETSWEVAQIVMDLPDDQHDQAELAPPATKRQMACPRDLDFSHDPRMWLALVKEGDGARCSPWVVFGQVDPDAGPDAAPALRKGRSSGASYVPISELANECWTRGLSCVFVGCDEWECQAEVPQVHPRAIRNLTLYTSLMAKQITLIEHRPAWVAVVRGDRGPTVQWLRRAGETDDESGTETGAAEVGAAERDATADPGKPPADDAARP